MLCMIISVFEVWTSTYVLRFPTCVIHTSLKLSFRPRETIFPPRFPSSSSNSTCQNNMRHPPQFLSFTCSFTFMSSSCSDTTILLVTQARNRGSKVAHPCFSHLMVAKTHLLHLLNNPNEGPLHFPSLPLLALIAWAITKSFNAMNTQPSWASQWPKREGQRSDLGCHQSQNLPWVTTTKDSLLPTPSFHTQV